MGEVEFYHLSGKITGTIVIDVTSKFSTEANEYEGREGGRYRF